MPRNGSGTYTLPTGNPVVTGTTIESNWANNTMSDIGTELTGSLARSGSGGMTGPLRITDGSQAVPALAFGNETGTGLYRAGTGEMWATVQGAQTLNLDATGVYVPADKTTTVDGAFVFNEAGADKDARFEGDTDANLLCTDASADAVGVGTNTPGAKLNISKSSNGATVEMLRLDNGGSGANTAAQVSFRAAATTYATITGGYGASAPLLNANVATSGAHTWAINSSDQMTLNSTGLGIGTSSPSSKLHVEGASQGDIKLQKTGTSGVSLYSDAAGTFKIYDNAGGVIRLTLDSSGNLGLGVTPSGWSQGKAIEVGGAGYGVWNGTGSAYLLANTYFNGGFKYASTGVQASHYYQYQGAHVWSTAPSGTAGNAITFTQAMTLDASGNLSVGGTSVYNASAGRGNITVEGSTSILNLGISGTLGGYVYHNGTDIDFRNAKNGALLFATNATERARIHASGGVSIGNTTDPGATNLSVSGTISDGTATLRPRVLATAVNSTSGTSIDFTGIPSWVKRITVMFNGVSTNGTSGISIRVGTSSGVVSSGYTTGNWSVTTAIASTVANSSTGFDFVNSGASSVHQGVLVLNQVDSGAWAGAGSFYDSNPTVRIAYITGRVSGLASAIDRVRITTSNGTDTFDAGSINIMYE